MTIIKKHFLYPSDLFVSKQPYKVTTLLGTCVAVCLFDKELKIGGINHYLLSFSHSNNNEPLKYGNTSIQTLIKKMLNLGCKKENIVAKILGGAQQANNYYDTGVQNVFIATQTLIEENINIIGKNVGGEKGRKIIFYTHTGEVFMKYLTELLSSQAMLQKEIIKKI